MIPGLARGVERIGSRVIEHARVRPTYAHRATQDHLDRIVDVFHEGYRHGCRARDVEALLGRLSRIEPHLQGFAYEGAAMALVLLDRLTPWARTRFSRFLSAAARHVYVLHVGAGWAFASLGMREGAPFRSLDPVLRWLALDGMGFHDGYIRCANGLSRQSRRGRLSSYGARAFDQGLGRSLWFTANAQPGAIAAAIDAVQPDRRGDLWSGVGLACAYAGGVTTSGLVELRTAAGDAWPHLAQGVVFAAEAQIRGNDFAPAHTQSACDVICHLSAADAARIARDTAAGLSADGDRPAYEVWRSRIRSRMVGMNL